MLKDTEVENISIFYFPNVDDRKNHPKINTYIYLSTRILHKDANNVESLIINSVVF